MGTVARRSIFIRTGTSLAVPEVSNGRLVRLRGGVVRLPQDRRFEPVDDAEHRIVPQRRQLANLVELNAEEVIGHTPREKIGQNVQLRGSPGSGNGVVMRSPPVRGSRRKSAKSRCICRGGGI